MAALPKISLEKARAVAMPAARPALSAICVRHLLRSKMPTGKEVGGGDTVRIALVYGVPTNSLQVVAPTGAAHSVEANDEGTVVDAVDDGCAGSVGIINRSLEDPLGPNESMD